MDILGNPIKVIQVQVILFGIMQLVGKSCYDNIYHSLTNHL